MNYSLIPESGIYAGIPRTLLLESLAKIIPADILQKLILLFIFYLIPAGFFRLTSVFEKKGNDHKALRVLASTLYLWNPFVYSRLMAGHWLFLFGYALAPIFVFHLIKFYRSDLKKNQKEFVRHFIFLNLTWLIGTLLSVHHLYLFGIIFLTYSAAQFFGDWRKTLRKFLLVTSVIVLLNSLWIIPTVARGSKLDSFTERDLLLFASSPDSQLGMLGNLLTFYGFWAEKTLFLLPKRIIAYWPLPLLIMAIPIFIYWLSYLPLKLFKKLKIGLRKPKVSLKITIPFLIIGLLGIILSLGSLGIGKPIYDLLYIKSSLLRPFREPQKFLSLYILSFSLFFYLGLRVWVERMVKNQNFLTTKQLKRLSKNLTRKSFNLIFKKILLLAYLILIISTTYTFVWGGYRQLTTTNYPSSWEELQNESKDSGKRILVLPYQSYANFSFSDRRIATPAKLYFSSETLVKKSIDELSRGKCDVTCLFCLNKNDDTDTWYEALEKHDVKYILVNKNDDWKDYSFLQKDSRFEKIIEDQHAFVLELAD
ncbi:MAG TPA: hypothetical protein ENI23_01060 [bacterium]|nr:hypothetical protein [bacterium]